MHRNLITMRGLADGSKAQSEKIEKRLQEILEQSNLSLKLQQEFLEYVRRLHKVVDDSMEKSIAFLKALTEDDDFPDI